MEYYSMLKRNGLSSHEKTWKNLKYILLREANLQRLHAVGFQQNDILGKAKLWRQLKDQRFPGVWWGKR